MEILEAFDATGSAHSAAQLAGVDPKTVRRYVAARDAGAPVTGPSRRDRITDPFLPKIEELVDQSRGKIRGDKVHERIVAMGFDGDERTTRRAVAEAKRAWTAGHRRTYRPWITEPGLWLQFDWGQGPKVPGPDGTTGAPRTPQPRARSAAEAAFLDIGEGAHAWLVEASAVGTVRIRAKMADAVELAALVGPSRVDHALGVAAAAGRFAEADLAAIVDHYATSEPDDDLVIADEDYSAQPGTNAWAGFTTTSSQPTSSPTSKETTR